MTITRRTVLKGSAWSLPVIAVAVAVPLAAASETPAGYACLRFIGTPSFAKNELKLKVQNTCQQTARNVLVTIAWADTTTVIPLGDIAPHGHAETEHYRDQTIPAGTVVTLTASADNAPATQPVVVQR